MHLNLPIFRLINRPAEAYTQLWNRAFNTKSGKGTNLPLDLMLKHKTNYMKELVRQQRAN